MAPQPCHLAPCWSPSVMMGVRDLQVIGETGLPGRHTGMFRERPQPALSRVCCTDDYAYFWYPVKPVTGAIHQLPGLSAWQLPEDSRVFSEAEPERAGLAGVQLAEACQGCGWHGQKLRLFRKGRRHSLLRALQTLRFQTREGALRWRKPQTLRTKAMKGPGLWPVRHGVRGNL